jgi:hypothetical protein
LNLENYFTKDFSKDCQNLKEINRELIDFDAVRKELWAQLSSVDAIGYISLNM